MFEDQEEKKKEEMEQDGSEGKMKIVQRQRKECKVIGMRCKIYYKRTEIERKGP